MKLRHQFKTFAARRSQKGSAVIVVMALLAILLIYVGGNLLILRNLDRTVKLVDRQQIHRLESLPSTQANAVADLQTGSLLTPSNPPAPSAK